jgi:BlaI family transcriptional regulator, penicillinase repressor
MTPVPRPSRRSRHCTLDRFCNGSLEEVLLGMVDSKMLDRRELQALADKITEAKGRKT